MSMSSVTRISEKKEKRYFLNLPYWFWILVISFSMLELWLLKSQTLTALAFAGHDDALFIKLAKSILSGHWLGEYNNLTLTKGAFYPLWIALSFVIGIPLKLSEHLLYIFSCLVFIFAMRQLYKNNITLIIFFIILLFNPMNYTNQPTLRVLRDGIYPSLTLLICACSIALLLRINNKIKELIGWSTGLGFALSAFWHTREEGVWLIPLIALIYLIIFIRLLVQKQNNWKRKILILLIPFIIWFISIQIICGLNKLYYGVYKTVEFRSDGFLSAYGSLARIKHAEWQPYVPVPKETRLQIYAVSPSFAQLKPYLEGDPGKGWSQYGRGNNGEIEGWFMWAFRGAVESVGYYKTASDAEAFYNNMANEINEACNLKKLDCYPKRKSMMTPWDNKYLHPFISTLKESFVFMIQFKNFDPQPQVSDKSEKGLKLFKDITGQDYTEDKRPIISINGWTFNERSQVALSIVGENGEVLQKNVSFNPSLDVYTHFLSLGKDIILAKNSRFNISVPCDGKCYLFLDENIEKIPLDGSIKSLEKNQYHLFLDSIEISNNNTDSPLTWVNNFKIAVLKMIGVLYQKLNPIVFFLSLGLYIIISLKLILKKEGLLVWTVTSAILGSIFIRLVLITLIDISSFPAVNTIYSSPGYPLVLLFELVSISSIIAGFRTWINRSSITVH